jgi:4-hydroxybenzoate polyprenyltransferase
MSTWAELVARYLHERYGARPFIPLALTLGFAGRIAVGARLDSPWSLPPSILLCYLLVLAFRVWDDLEDRARDQREHPERVLVRSSTRAPWFALLAGAFAISATIIVAGSDSGGRLLLLGAGCLVLFGWYRVRRALAAPPLIGTLVVFGKYPLIALVAAPRATSLPIGTTTLVLLALYLVLLAYELFDDKSLRGFAS